MEIDNINSTSSSAEIESEPNVQSVPKGLASVKDSVTLSGIHRRAPKPPMLYAIAFSFCLVMFETITFLIRSLNDAIKSIFGWKDHQKYLYRELHQVAAQKNEGKIREFLIQHKENSLPIAFLFGELLHMPELFPHLLDMLKGANICLNDYGFFCRRWNEHPSCYKRLSSHNYQGDECYAIEHLLFWQDPEGHTRLQFENSQWRGIFDSIHHIIDFLRYRRDNEQQGVTGASPHTEDYCLNVEIDLERFISKKLDA